MKGTLLTIGILMSPAAGLMAQTLSLRVSEPSLVFQGQVDGDSTPAQTVRINSSDPQRAIRFGITVESVSGYQQPAWLQVFGVPSDGVPVLRSTPARLVVSANPGRLAAGEYRARLRLTATDTTPATVLLDVQFRIVDAPPLLEVAPAVLRFAARAGGGSQSQILFVRSSRGGGGQPVGVEFTERAPWVSLAPVDIQTAQDAPAAVRVIVDPGGLSPGAYRARIRVEPPAGQEPVLVPVTLLVVGETGFLQLNPTGLQFEMRQGSGTTLSRPVNIFNFGPEPIAWTAQIIRGADWIRLTSTRGLASFRDPGALDVQIADWNRAPGLYYGLIRVASPGALGSPQFVTVTLNVRAADAVTSPVPSPAGLLYVVNEGGPAATQQVRIYASSRNTLGFQAATATGDNLGWLRAGSASGNTSTEAPADLDVAVTPTNLKPGFYFGEMNLTVSNDEIRAVNIAAVVVPRRTTAAGQPGAEGCTPERMAAVQTALVSNFSTPAGWPVPLGVRVVDDCGDAVNNAQAVATFTNGDPPLPMRQAGASGAYSATWVPTNAGSQINVTVRISAPGFPSVAANVTGAVSAGTAPILAPGGTVNNFSFAGASPVAPGMVASVFGSGLAGGEATAAGAQLPTELRGTTVLIGGLPAPLYFVSPGQLALQVPMELPDTQPHQIVISANGQLSAPDTLDVAPAAPGLLAAQGAVVAQRVDGSFVTSAAPARPGEALVLYLVGMGRTDPDQSSGTPASTTLARTRAAPAVTIGETTAAVLFAGLTPGFVGLYQINFLVPQGLPAGDHVLEVSQSGVASNRGTLPVGP